ncbi:NUDIX domain-containing protein [uncultured Acetobacteroides sp.]|uniref:NUDIX hydrolase n=1 Tax=uncultured Acetobacteroides sp. TaxID=1760811 RepID=UPI0029F5555F|nr:NUDIX domain-containing protein [uncultured Acetobacteroides sp.]
MHLSTHPRQVLKFCPKCGSNHFAPQNDNSLQCEACGFRLYYNAASSVAAIILDDEGRLLLTRRAIDPCKGTLDLPGGFVSVDESSEEALAREIKEELGAEVLEYRYVRSYPNRYEYSGLTVFTNDAAFMCTLRDYSVIKPADDVCGVEWFYLQDVKLEDIGIKSIRTMVRDFIEQL